MHSEDTLADLYQDLNFALDGFIAEVKSQGLWENTVIVQGSDFGRSLNTNSNSGTDHAVSLFYSCLLLYVHLTCLVSYAILIVIRLYHT